MSNPAPKLKAARECPPEQVTLVYRQQDGAHSFSILEVPGLVVLDHDLKRAFRSGVVGAGKLVSTVCNRTVQYKAGMTFAEFKAKIERQQGTANRDRVVTIPAKSSTRALRPRVVSSSASRYESPPFLKGGRVVDALDPAIYSLASQPWSYETVDANLRQWGYSPVGDHSDKSQMRPSGFLIWGKDDRTTGEKKVFVISKPLWRAAGYRKPVWPANLITKAMVRQEVFQRTGSDDP